jgi:hypothetical protein
LRSPFALVERRALGRPQRNGHDVRRADQRCADNRAQERSEQRARHGLAIMARAALADQGAYQRARVRVMGCKAGREVAVIREQRARAQIDDGQLAAG